MTTFAAVKAMAMSQRGVKESPANSNRQKYGMWYGWNGVPWCDQFISWCFNQTGGLSLIGGKSASVALTASRMRAKGQYGSTPRAGALAIFNNYSHIELVVGVNLNGTVATIGGNTSDSVGGSISNGGGVFANTRPRSLIRGYGYPAYTPSAPVPPTGVRRNPETVRRIQHAVHVAEDGAWGPITSAAATAAIHAHNVAAIKGIQAAIGVVADGLWGPKSQAAWNLVYAANYGKP